jgi:hypothetical protein
LVSVDFVSVFDSPLLSLLSLLFLLFDDELLLLLLVSELDERLSVLYQPEPLKIMPAG